MKDQKDPRLWQQAKARAGFKTHFTLYLIVNVLLWGIWFFTGGFNKYPWPLWPSIGWGIAIISNYLSVYKFSGTADKEYEKLKREH